MPRLLPYRVSVETDRPTFPDMCICCGAEATEEYRPTPPGKQAGMPEDNVVLSYPYCKDCLEHVRASQSLASASLIALNIAVWSVAFTLQLTPAYIVFGGPVVAGLYLAGARKKNMPKLKPDCTAAELACRAIWYRKNTYVFSFANEKYAESFAQANRASLSVD